jgi:hypothetical protein
METMWFVCLRLESFVSVVASYEGMFPKKEIDMVLGSM